MELGTIGPYGEHLGTRNRDADGLVSRIVPQEMRDVAGQGSDVHGGRHGVLQGQHLQRLNRRFFVAADRSPGEVAGLLDARKIAAAGSGGTPQQFERTEKRLQAAADVVQIGRRAALVDRRSGCSLVQVGQT